MENKHVKVTTRGFGLLFRFTPGQSRFGPGGNLCREYHVSHWCLGLKEKWKTILRTINLHEISAFDHNKCAQRA